MNKKYLFIVLLAFTFSCDNSNHSDLDEISVEELEKKADDLKNIFYMIPSPMETAIVLKKAGATYENKLLNEPSKSGKYDTKLKKAVNLGVYGADLSYATLFDQTQETMFYVSSAKKLAESLGVMKAFDETTVQRIEDNIENKDSMKMIVSEVYWIADTYLKENESVALSTMIIFGGWIEALHIASGVYQKSPNNEELKKRIVEQKYSLENLHNLVMSDTKDPDLQELKKDLLALKEVYDLLRIEEDTASDLVQDKSGVTNITGESKIIASKQDLTKMFDKVNEIRSKYTEI